MSVEIFTFLLIEKLLNSRSIFWKSGVPVTIFLNNSFHISDTIHCFSNSLNPIMTLSYRVECFIECPVEFWRKGHLKSTISRYLCREFRYNCLNFHEAYLVRKYFCSSEYRLCTSFSGLLCSSFEISLYSLLIYILSAASLAISFIQWSKSMKVSHCGSHDAKNFQSLLKKVSAVHFPSQILVFNTFPRYISFTSYFLLSFAESITWSCIYSPSILSRVLLSV